MLQVTTKTRTDKTKATFVHVPTSELEMALTRVTSTPFTRRDRVVDKSHTKMGQLFGEAKTHFTEFLLAEDHYIAGERVIPRILVRDQTFAGKQMQVFVGFYRFVCSNGLIVPVSKDTSTQLTVSHRMSSKQKLEQLDDAIAAALQHVILAKDILNEATSIKVDARYIISQLATFSPKQKERLTNSLVQARREDDVTTAFGLYNHINEWDRRHGRSFAKVTERDSTMLQAILSIAA